MARLVLVTGGARSGKSTYARQLAEAQAGAWVFVATCPVSDDEMAERVRRHQTERAGRGWVTVEEPLALPAVLAARREAGVVLVDCLTLWVANLLGTHTSDRLPAEDAFAAEFDALVAAATAHPGVVILVTNEVGWGIVPENALARRFRDILGRCHQRLAAASDQVVLCVCGCPLVVKDRASEEPHGA